MTTALIIVDIQNDYFKGGKSPLSGAEAAAAQAQKALALFREKGLPVFYIRHISLEKGASFFLPGSKGAKLYDQLSPLPNEAVIEKHAPDSFFETGLKNRLDALDIKRLVICGMMSHMCIDTTVRSAYAKGYDVLLLHDACATKDLVWNGAVIPAKAVHASFMAALNGSFAQAIATDELDGIL
jgi:nicotinamidase-related amidase